MTKPEHAVTDSRRRRLLYRATHRGTHENDLLIGGFVRAGLGGFDSDELAALEALLELPDVVLADCLTGRSPIPAECDSPMLRRVREAVIHGLVGREAAR
jgi:antitoxin CptB